MGEDTLLAPAPEYTEIITVFDLPVHYKDWQLQGIALTISDVKLAKQTSYCWYKAFKSIRTSPY